MKLPEKNFFESRLARTGCPGLSFIAIDDFEIVRKIHLGTKRVGKDLPVDSHTIFQAASISKVVFALALVDVAREHFVGFEKPVEKYLKTWRPPKGSPKVTLRQLMNHSAGATVDGFPGYTPGLALPNLDQILEGKPPCNTPAIRIKGNPGESFAYSGGGVTIAQKLFEDLTKAPFAEEMEERILAPLAMNHSTFEKLLDPAWTEHAARGHVGKDNRELPGGWRVYPESAAAGLWTSAEDLAGLGREVLMAITGCSTRLELGEDELEDMVTPRLRDQGPTKASVGFGWFCAGEGDGLQFGHNGGNAGYVAQICLRPMRGKGFVFLANSDTAFPILEELLDLTEFSRSLL